MQWFRIQWNFPQLFQPREIIRKVSDIKDLVSLASHRAAEFTSIELLHPDRKIRTMDGITHDHREPVKYWFNAAIRDRTGPGPDIAVNELYFSLKDIGGIEKIGDWVRVAENNRTALARVMSVIYGADSYLQDKLMNCLVSLELFDRNRRAGIAHETDEDGYYRSRLHATLISLASHSTPLLVSMQPNGSKLPSCIGTVWLTISSRYSRARRQQFI